MKGIEMKLTREMITEHKSIGTYLGVSTHIQKKITGRVCGTERIHFLAVLADLMRQTFPQEFNYLEIGTLFGGSLCAAACHIQPMAESEKYAGIDIFTYYGNPIDNKSQTEVSRAQAMENIKKIGPPNCELFEGNSQDPEIIKAALSYLENGVQLLFIDGNHSWKGVLADVDKYSGSVVPGGLMVFDDYHDNAWPGVTEAIQRLDKAGWNDVGPLILGGQVCFYVMQKNDSSL